MVDNKQDKFFGIITRILEINKNIMCIVNLFENVPTNFENLSPLTQKHLDNYFIYVKRSEKYVIVKPCHIIRRCILVESERDMVVCPCVDLNEHD